MELQRSSRISFENKSLLYHLILHFLIYLAQSAAPDHRQHYPLWSLDITNQIASLSVVFNEDFQKQQQNCKEKTCTALDLWWVNKIDCKSGKIVITNLGSFHQLKPPEIVVLLLGWGRLIHTNYVESTKYREWPQEHTHVSGVRFCVFMSAEFLKRNQLERKGWIYK